MTKSNFRAVVVVANMNVVNVSRVLIAVFGTMVTTWYLITPYIVQPYSGIIHDLLTNSDLERLSDETSIGDGQVIVENWTKWRIYVHGREQTIGGGNAQAVSLAGRGKKTVLSMDWRSDYEIVIRETKAGISASIFAPPFSCQRWGIYNHIKAAISGRTVRILPRFLFGIPSKTVKSIYSSDNSQQAAEQKVALPVVGVFSQSTKFDRVIIQAYMNLVTLSVILLIWTNNPPAVLKKTTVSSSGRETSDVPAAN